MTTLMRGLEAFIDWEESELDSRRTFLSVGMPMCTMNNEYGICYLKCPDVIYTWISIIEVLVYIRLGI